jgi:hypothetical protein
MAVAAVGTIVSAISALDTKAEYDRANREIVAANRIRFEGFATSVQVIESYKANCGALTSNFSQFNLRLQSRLASIASAATTEEARLLLEQLAKTLPRKKDGSLDLKGLGLEKALQLAEAQIIYSILRSQAVSVSAESLVGYNTAVQNLRKTKALALQWERFGRALASPLSPIEANIPAGLVEEREVLAFQKRFFELTAATIGASFNKERAPAVLSRLSQAASHAKDLRLRFYKNPRTHRLEKGIQQLQRLLQ